MMKQNFDESAIQEAIRLSQTDAGQQLLAMLKSSDQKQLKKAAVEAASGDYQQLPQTLAAFFSSPEARQLLEQLGRERHG